METARKQAMAIPEPLRLAMPIIGWGDGLLTEAVWDSWNLDRQITMLNRWMKILNARMLKHMESLQ